MVPSGGRVDVFVIDCAMSYGKAYGHEPCSAHQEPIHLHRSCSSLPTGALKRDSTIFNF